MRRALLLAAALAALAAVPNAAAATVTGAVVAKDAERRAAVVVSGGAARTVRLGARYRSVRVGRRIAVTATPMADGTYEARRVRVAGSASTARFRATVVRHDRARGRVIVSAGGSVFDVRSGRGGRSLASAEATGLAPGDTVVVTIRVSAAATWSTGIHETGRARLVQLEGIFLGPEGDGFDVAVVAHGRVHVDVPEGAVVPDFDRGDQVSMVVLIGRDGTFTFIRGVDESERKKDRPHHREGIEAHGVLVEKAPYAVIVRTEDDRRVECAVPSGMDLSLFRVGERVKIHCVSRDNRDVLIKIQSGYGWVKADGSGELSVHGALSKGTGTISVRRDDGISVACSVPSGVDLSPFRGGERVKLHCHLGDGGFVFASMRSETASLDEDGVLRLYGSGLLQARSGAAVSVRRPDGSTFSCNGPADLHLEYFAVGSPVHLECRVDGDGNTLLKISDERYRVGADGSVELWIHGTLDATTGTSVTVRASDGATVTCAVPTGTDLSKFGVGTSVKINCHLRDGEFQLGSMRSENAVIEFER